MKKLWKDIKVGDTMKDGSIVTQIHRTHTEECCKLIYDNDKEFTCSYRHVLLVDIHNLPKKGKNELESLCTFVPLEENYEIFCNEELSIEEKDIIDRFCHGESISTKIETIQDDEVEIYKFYFSNDNIKQIIIKNVITKSEPQKVDENTYWLTLRGIEYLMNKYKVDLYCNGNILNSVTNIGMQDCFCISTNTGRYET